MSLASKQDGKGLLFCDYRFLLKDNDIFFDEDITFDSLQSQLGARYVLDIEDGLVVLRREDRQMELPLTLS